MLQPSLLENTAPRPDPSLGEPVIWLQQLVLLESLDAEEPIQSIPFRRGLNIIATEEAKPEDQGPVGHDVGKTMLVRIIRYCLGEEHYCDQDTRGAVSEKLPDAYALAKFRVAGETWCVARPLGKLAGASCSWCEQTEDLDSIRHPEERRRFADFVDALNEATKACYADVGLPHAEDRRARWQDLLGWLSRDQECLFRHPAEWRVPESQAGPRVLPKEDAYLVMRMALGLLTEQELAAAREHEKLRNEFAEKQTRMERLSAFLERTEGYLRTSLRTRDCDPDELPQGNLLSAPLLELTDGKLESLTGLQQDLWERPDIQESQAKLDAAIEQQAVLQHAVNDLDAQAQTLEDALQGLRTQSDESFLAGLGGSGFKCSYWPANKEAAKAAGCPGEDDLPKDDDGKDLRRQANIRSAENDLKVVKEKLERQQEALAGARTDVDRLRAELRRRMAEQFRDKQGIAETIGRWREIKQQAENFQVGWQEKDSLDQALERKDAVLREARQAVSAAQEAFARDLGTLSACYKEVAQAILSQDVDGKVVIDGNGVHPRIEGASSSGTTLKMCTRVLGFDLACLKASICGIGHLPRIWMHDSPRAADTEDTLYHRLMQIVGDLEAEFKDTPPTFQHIWTTTSTPPENLNDAPYVCLRLHARDDAGRLLKRSFALGEVAEDTTLVAEQGETPS